MKKITALIFACALCFLMISCAKKNGDATESTSGGTTSVTTATATATEIATETQGTTSVTKSDDEKSEISLTAPKVIFVTGGKEYECTYSEKASSTVVGGGTTAVMCGRAILGGFKRQTLVGKIPEIAMGDTAYITSDGERLENATLSLYSADSDGGEGERVSISELSGKIKGGNYIAELFITKSAEDGSSVTYAFYVLLKG